MSAQLLIALLVAGGVGIPIAVAALIWGANFILTSCFRPRTAATTRPWIWLSVPLAGVLAVLAYPLIGSIVSSFKGATGTRWVGYRNFVWAFRGEALDVLRNNVIWLLVFPAATLLVALVVAVLFDKVRYERVVMTIIVTSTAVSFTAGSIVWREIYEYEEGDTQTGTVNAILAALPFGTPRPWLQEDIVNTLALIVVAVWSVTGVAALILSAAVKNVPKDLIEAAKLDGAGSVKTFANVTLPAIWPAILVVGTTEVIFSLKAFDFVYVMTNGNYNTDTIANRMYHELFTANNLGHASAMSVLLLVVAIPVIAINIREFRSGVGNE